MRTKTSLLVGLILFTPTIGRTARAQCQDAVKTKIVHSINDKYKNPAEPDFSFTFASSTPSDLLANLKSIGFEVEKLQDDRADLSFAYHIKNPKVLKYNHWRLLISMVGKYAVLFRLQELRRDELVTVLSNLNWPKEREIIKVLSNNRFEVLSKGVLCCRSPLARLQNMESGWTIRFWHALFRDEPGLPWKTTNPSTCP
jgi:hypothetical protein